MDKPVKTKIIGSILEVTIDRPKANAIDAKTSIILGEIFADFRDNPKLKVAIITGSSKGIGLAIARGLAEFGAKVVLSSRDQNAVDIAAKKFKKVQRGNKKVDPYTLPL